MKMNRSTKGFTLVEIMIVVVIIGLLAAMAIPAFQKVRENSIGKTMINDARQLAAAAQQYVLENTTVTKVGITADSATGVISGPLSEYVRVISKGTTATDYDATVAQGATAFTLANQQYKSAATQGFDTEGHLTVK